MSKVEVETYYKRQAKDLVNLFFDQKILHPELTRETMDWLEDYLGYILQSGAQSAAKTAELLMRIDHRED